MTLARQNQTLLGILDHLVRNLGSMTLDLAFEDFGLDPAMEPLFDGICLWARNEGLITVTSATNLDDAHTARSYARLNNPAITSLGVIVASVAVEHLDGNVILATAMAHNPSLAHMVCGGLSRGNGKVARAA